MIGNNTLHLNETTMVEALQRYLNWLMGEHAPKVQSVKEREVGITSVFEVTVVSERPNP